MTRKEIRRMQLQNEIKILDNQWIGSGYLMPPARIAEARLELERLDDADEVTGPEDLVVAVESWLKHPTHFEPSFDGGGRLVLRLTKTGAHQLEKTFREAIAAQVQDALQVGKGRRSSQPGIALGAELQ